MESMTKILVVDDNRIVCDMLKKHLDGEYCISSALSYTQLKEEVGDCCPDIIILDVEMPDCNGYEVCCELKKSPDTKQIPIIFHSAADSLESRMQGYEAGAADYIKKGCDLEEMKAKLKVIAQSLLCNLRLQENALEAEKTAVEALATTSEVGKAIRFVENSYVVSEYQELSNLLIEFCRQLDLSVVVMFVSDARQFYSSSSNDVALIESELMNKLHGTTRFIDFGCRTLVNYPRVSLLVKNMPVNDFQRYGRIKDILPLVMGAVDAKVRVLDAEKALSEQCVSLNASMERAQYTLSAVGENYKENMEVVSIVMSELISSLISDISLMDMVEADEDRILKSVENTSKELNIVLRENGQTDSILKDLVSVLEKLTKDQSRILEESFSNKNDVMDGCQADIELF